MHKVGFNGTVVLLLFGDPFNGSVCVPIGFSFLCRSLDIKSCNSSTWSCFHMFFYKQAVIRRSVTEKSPFVSQEAFDLIKIVSSSHDFTFINVPLSETVDYL